MSEPLVEPDVQPSTTAAPAAVQADQGDLKDPAASGLADPLASMGRATGSAGGGGGGGGPVQHAGRVGSFVQFAARAGLSDSLGASTLSDSIAVQADTGDVGSADAVQATAAEGVKGAGGPLPHLDAIQASFGKHDVSGVKAHTGAEASKANAAMGSSAYATGSDVALSAGGTDLHTVAHEAAHVVQQRAGVQLKGGVGAAGDAYEQHADKVADAVVQGKSAEPILDTMAGGGSGGGGVQAKAKSDLVQHKGDTSVSFVDETSYELDLKIPTPIPGLEILVGGKAKTSKEVKNGETWSKFGIQMSAGIALSFKIFALALKITGEVEGEVKGDKNPKEVAEEALNEFARWKIADELDDIAKEREKLETQFNSTQDKVMDAWDELALTDDKEWENATTSWNFFSKTPREQVKSAGKDLQKTIGKVFSKVGYKAKGDEYKAYFDPDAMVANMEKLGELEASEGKKHINNEIVTFLRTYERAERETMRGFDALDFKNNPNVHFKAGVSVDISFKAEFTPAVSAELSVGGGIMISDGEGEDFDHSVKKILRGHIKASAGSAEGKLFATYESKDDDKSFELGLDLKTPPVMVPLNDDNLVKAANAAASLLKSDSQELKDDAKGKGFYLTKKGRFEAMLEKGKELAATLKPAIDMVKLAQGAAGTFESASRNILLGGKVVIKNGELGGEVSFGLGQESSVKLGVAEAKKSTNRVVKVALG